MKRHLFWLVVGGLLIVALAVACDDGGDGNGGEPSPTSAPTGVATPTPTGPPFPFEGPVGIDLTTFGAFYTQGEPVRLAITVAAAERITLYYRTTQRYDIIIADSEGNEVWRWSKDKAFGEVLEEVSLEENETLAFNETWDQRDNDGQPVPPGDYRVTVTSTHCDANYENCGQLSASATIQIRAT
jgi:hypothetical protein